MRREEPKASARADGPERTKRRGRPPTRTDAETRRLVIDAASREFLEHGFGVSTADIARRAGVSKRTIYELVSNKANLLAEIIEERRASMMAGFDLEGSDDSSPSEILTRMLLAIARVAVSEDVVSFNRLVISQATEFPELARAFYDAGPAKLIGLVANVLRSLEQRGSIRLDDALRAAASLLNAAVAEPVRAGMLQARAPMTEGQIRAAVDAAVSTFLDGCRRGGSGHALSTATNASTATSLPTSRNR